MNEGPIAQRSAGKIPVGRLRMGQIVNPTQPQRASIPSKFETILNTGQRERDGFARRTHRFDEQENELPGPGSYYSPPPLIKDPSGEHSSKRGTAAFAATEKRFYEAPRPLFVTPGPGKYDGAAGTSSGISLKGTSSFVTPVAKAAVKNLNKISVPGPGQYEVSVRTTSPHSRETATFRSNTARKAFDDGMKAAIPGPGAYADSLLKFKSTAEIATVIHSRPPLVNNPLDPEHPRPAPPVEGAVFRSQTDRDGKPLKRAERLDPHNLPPMPGHPPGTTPRRPISAVPSDTADTEKVVRPSSVFAPTSLDRFGNPIVRYTNVEVTTPGPGQYGDLDHSKKMLISSSWALSAVDRFEDPKGRPPGPAFYEPKPLGKPKFRAVKPGQWN